MLSIASTDQVWGSGWSKCDLSLHTSHNLMFCSIITDDRPKEITQNMNIPDTRFIVFANPSVSSRLREFFFFFFFFFFLVHDFNERLIQSTALLRLTSLFSSRLVFSSPNPKTDKSAYSSIVRSLSFVRWQLILNCLSTNSGCVGWSVA